MLPRVLSLVLALGALGAQAADGLMPPAAAAAWPHWQARISVQTDTPSPLAASRLFDPSGPQRGVQGASVLGDYYFATPSFGAFRASGGLMTGSQAGAPLVNAAAGPRLGLAVNSAPAPLAALGTYAAGDLPGTVPYVGLGFTGAPWRNGLSLSADLGVVAEKPNAALGVGRAVFGTQGMDSALRELRLSPVLQLVLRYNF
jgi:hypothetical protein